jgi:hypothetical protein
MSKNRPSDATGASALTKVTDTVRSPRNLQNRYPGRMALRVPGELIAAVEEVAGARFTTPSQYVRQAILAALRADGVALKPEGGRQ